MLSTDDRFPSKLVRNTPSQSSRENSGTRIWIKTGNVSRGAAIVIGDSNEVTASAATAARAPAADAVSTERAPAVDVVPVSRVQLRRLKDDEEWLNSYILGYMHYFAQRTLCAQLRSKLEAGMGDLTIKEYWSESGDSLENIMDDLMHFEGLSKLRDDVLIAEPMTTLQTDLENAQKLIQKGSAGLRRKEQQDWLRDKSEQGARQLKKAGDVLDRLIEYCKGCAIRKLEAVISATSMILPEVQISPAPEETIKSAQSKAGLPVASQFLGTRNSSSVNPSFAPGQGE